MTSTSAGSSSATTRPTRATALSANRSVNREHFARRVGIVTALNPVLGYEQTTDLAAEAMRTDKSILDLVREQKLLSDDQINKLMDVKALTGQR